MRIAYADPPYPGCAHLYASHPDFAGEVDHAALVTRLNAEFDGWILHTHVPGLAIVAPLPPPCSRLRVGQGLRGVQAQHPRRLRMGAGLGEGGAQTRGEQEARHA